MNILVANLGSTSFKCKLFATNNEGVIGPPLADAVADRIGQGQSNWRVTASDQQANGTAELATHAAAIELQLDYLVRLGAIDSIGDFDAIGFKAVHGGPISGAVRVDEDVLATMRQFADIAPQHNPPYIAAMKAFAQQLPGVPQVAAFETAYHQTIPLARQVYGIPYEWVEQLGIRRYGFHGASHHYIATRMGELAPQLCKLVSCHLGGSCSINAIDHGRSVANSFGMTTQTGVFHSSRIGDFDTFALMKLLQAGHPLDAIWKALGKESGLKGLSGVSADMREVEQAAEEGNERAQLALDAFVESCRHYIGAYLAVLNGTDALIFTGGIGQNGKAIRQAIGKNLDFAGIRIDIEKNEIATGLDEERIDADGSTVQVWVLPTNEELIVAQQAIDVLKRSAVQRN
jgi:acetate kinase